MAYKRTINVPFEPAAEGFSLLELTASIAIILIAATIGVFVFSSVLPVYRADAAMQQVEIQLRQAREVAVDQRRTILVTFQGTGEVVTVRQNLNITTTPPTVISTTTLADYLMNPNQMSYQVLPGVPDTPDAFGNSSAVNFNCGSTPMPCTITFQSDGTVVSQSGAYVNGTVFLGTAGNSLTARAITILGATGRIKGYRWNGTVWS